MGSSSIHSTNIILNHDFSGGLHSWHPNSCHAFVTSEESAYPEVVTTKLSGHYAVATNREKSWQELKQVITERVSTGCTYTVCALVGVSGAPHGVDNVEATLILEYGNSEEILVHWKHDSALGNSILWLRRVPRLDLLVVGLHIFPVDRHARFSHLKQQIEKIRKRDIILKFTSDSGPLVGNSVKIRQTENSFPFGSFINRRNIVNEEFVDFFSKNFNRTVFGNELKWVWTERRKGKLNYKEAEELLNFCISRNIQVRGHCIFEEVESAVQSWVSGLEEDELMSAVENRLSDLLTCYKGKFKHYDVNNEMLHGSFYQDHWGEYIRAYMFKIATQLDPSAILFVNDYHIEDGCTCDPRSSPEKYIEHIIDLQEQGAPLERIGIQGHMNSPVGPIVCSTLDKLRDKIPGLPIRFTELDVSSDNEHIRADDLEVMLREAFAHPAVDGIMLWGFWELLMSRDNAHLVNAEWDINEAGNRYLALKQEWLSHAHGIQTNKVNLSLEDFMDRTKLKLLLL
ncbi:endo-1,4-beta-xylanase A-like [Olea europaea subsp. europaea]|uniref:Endo-1,4-beta-xylanase A-like n=1 Tax=Olea europaea subsp. europaea TaxID=158383 RepID=A0A8S0P7L3_OLEEU|nr:endo-1,4-beta-xylanase A-like [Olea europaea subsp. europaea]